MYYAKYLGRIEKFATVDEILGYTKIYPNCQQIRVKGLPWNVYHHHHDASAPGPCWLWPVFCCWLAADFRVRWITAPCQRTRTRWCAPPMPRWARNTAPAELHRKRALTALALSGGYTKKTATRFRALLWTRPAQGIPCPKTRPAPVILWCFAPAQARAACIPAFTQAATALFTARAEAKRFEWKACPSPTGAASLLLYAVSCTDPYKTAQQINQPTYQFFSESAALP